jgi:Asp-tRNA(Asn)/Glu-tRNA(Gln) amidotransferase B subunit
MPASSEALGKSADEGFTAEAYLGETTIADTNELLPVVDRILAANVDQVAAYRNGKAGLLGFFVGQVMRETGGKADAKVVNELVRERLQA